MKIQCACGTKFEFEVTPEMVGNPVRFVCPSCGYDASEFVNNLVRQQFASSPSVPAPAPAPVAARPAPVRVQLHNPAPAAPEPAETNDSPGQPCSKHPGQFATEKCYVCSKPICPKCMELFGYVCSPLCKAKAESHGIDIPVYAGQKSVIEAKMWRKVGLVSGVLAFLVIAFLGAWFWYAWFGSTPKVAFSVRFPNPSYSGQSRWLAENQLVFLHGSELARYDLKTRKQVWSRTVLDQKQIEDQVARELEDAKATIQQAMREGWRKVPEMPTAEKLRRWAERNAAETLDLRVQSGNIWVLSPGKLTRYDAGTGQPIKEMPIPGGQLIAHGREFLMMDPLALGKQKITHLDLTNGEIRTEELGGSILPANTNVLVAGVAAKAGRAKPAAGGLSLTPGKEPAAPLDPDKVAAQVAKMSKPARIALPALLANSMNQERILAELNEEAGPGPAGAMQKDPDSMFTLMPTADGFLRFSVRLREKRIVQRKAMKAAPAKSVLDGNLNVTQTADVANEILNEMQRSRGGENVEEDESRYLVTLRRADGKDEWRGEVVGPPMLFPLETVNVLTANKVVYVFNKDNKLIWKSPLNYNVVGGFDSGDEGEVSYGLGPCVEHKGRLYVIDQGVLTAFDLPTGNAVWRLLSVGTVGIFFDDQDMVYVNTTTAGPEKIKYSRQIDITDRTATVVLKVDPANGKTIWSEQLGGYLRYVSGKFLYTASWFMPYEDEDALSGPDEPPYLKIKRINPSTGAEMWEHFQDRAPLDARFNRNTIRLVFKKEVQVLKFLTF
jgi:outer membrane protein assembly factor BamB